MKMKLAAFGFVCILLGAAIGAILGAKFARRRDAAPQPINLYPTDGNAFKTQKNGLYGKTVIMCGREWELRQP